MAVKVGVVGLGHVGRNVENRFRELGAEVVTYDRVSGERYPERELRECSFVVVCVGTPGRPGGEADISDVVEAVRSVPCAQVLLRSTVPPGTTEALVAETGKNICFSPEYVGESKFSKDRWDGWANDRVFQILGGSADVTRWFAAALTEISGPEPQFFQCTALEAELAKYMENSYFAVKVTFANEFYELCETLGADWYTVREAWLLDPRIERDHTAVFPSARGFSGRCLPKDVDAILQAAADRGLSMPLIRATRDANEYYRRLSGGASG